MSIHDGFLEIAAAAIDFELDDHERAELDHHLAGCDACRRTASGYREDAAAITAGTSPRLSAGRSATILADALRPRRAGSPLRLLSVAAVLMLLGAGVIVAGMGLQQLVRDPRLAIAPSASPSPSAGISTAPSADPSSSTDPSELPVETATATEPTIAGSLPIRGSGRDAGAQVRMAPGSSGELYVSIPTNGGWLLTLLDLSGESRDGWPVVIVGATSCDHLQRAEDGSIRMVCSLANPEGSQFSPIGAFAFDADGVTLPGWPVVLGDHGADGYFAARVIADQLALVVSASRGDVIPEGEPARDDWIMVVAADGTVRNGTKAVPGKDCCDPDAWTIGPDGVAYWVVRASDNDPFDPKWSSEVGVLTFSGPPAWYAGQGTIIDGIASRPAFDPGGQIRMAVASEPGGIGRMVWFSADSGGIADGFSRLGFPTLTSCTGIEGTCLDPVPPLISPDGTVFFIGTESSGMIAAAVARDSFDLMSGWPYRSNAAHQATGSCPTGSVCESSTLALPASGLDNVLYLIQAAPNDLAGGSIIGIGSNGRVVDGWPVELTRSGSAFWSVAVGSDGIVYALAIEPEPGDGSSATILAIDPDSTVRYTSTIIDP